MDSNSLMNIQFACHFLNILIGLSNRFCRRSQDIGMWFRYISFSCAQTHKHFIYQWDILLIFIEISQWCYSVNFWLGVHHSVKRNVSWLVDTGKYWKCNFTHGHAQNWSCCFRWSCTWMDRESNRIKILLRLLMIGLFTQLTKWHSTNCQ